MAVSVEVRMTTVAAKLRVVSFDVAAGTFNVAQSDGGFKLSPPLDALAWRWAERLGQVGVVVTRVHVADGVADGAPGTHVIDIVQGAASMRLKHTDAGDVHAMSALVGVPVVDTGLLDVVRQMCRLMSAWGFVDVDFIVS